MENPIAIIAIILAIIVLLLLFRVVRNSSSKKSRPVVDHTPLIQPTEVALNVVEQCCLQTLQQVAGPEYNIRTKIALTTLVKSGKNSEQQLLDFVLYSKKSSKPACAIQLQSAHQSDISTIERLLQQAGLPLYQLPRKSSYSAVKMRERLKDHIEKPMPTPDEMIATISMKAFRLCKKCDSQMELKRASAGPHKGMLFWVCEKHPDCSGVELYTE